MLCSDSIRISLYVGVKIRKLLLHDILLYDSLYQFLLAGLDVAVKFAMVFFVVCLIPFVFPFTLAYRFKKMLRDEILLF